MAFDASAVYYCKNPINLLWKNNKSTRHLGTHSKQCRNRKHDNPMKQCRHMHRVALGLGSNLDDRPTLIHQALKRLEHLGFHCDAVSGLIQTKAEECPPGTPEFLNAAAIGRWHGSPESLLNACQKVERDLGRPAEHGVNQSRTIDVDILLFDESTVAQPELTIPHPRMTQRRFVLEPLAQIAADWPVPGTEQTVDDWLKKLA